MKVQMKNLTLMHKDECFSYLYEACHPIVFSTSMMRVAQLRTQISHEQDFCAFHYSHMGKQKNFDAHQLERLLVITKHAL